MSRLNPRRNVLPQSPIGYLVRKNKRSFLESLTSKEGKVCGIPRKHPSLLRLRALKLAWAAWFKPRYQPSSLETESRKQSLILQPHAAPLSCRGRASRGTAALFL